MAGARAARSRTTRRPRRPPPRPRRGSRLRPRRRRPPTRPRPPTASRPRPPRCRRSAGLRRPSPPRRPPRTRPPRTPAHAAAGAATSPYVTPLVRKLAAEHAVPLETITGTGVGGRIRKQDVLEAARAQRAAQPAAAAERRCRRRPRRPSLSPARRSARRSRPPPRRLQRPRGSVRPAAGGVPSALRGTTQRMSRPRQVIAKRMVESLQTSAQLTTVVEADVTDDRRLRDAAEAATSRPARASS